MKNLISLAKIKPDTPKISDKYSYNLWRWVKNFKKDYQQEPAVYAVVPKGQTFSVDELKKGYWSTYLGKKNYDGSLSASELNHVLGIDQRIWAIIPGVHFEAEELVEITDLFWTTYQAIGRCLFHSHDVTDLVGESEHYSYDDTQTKRTCNWCGHAQELKVVEVVKIEKHWV